MSTWFRTISNERSWTARAVPVALPTTGQEVPIEIELIEGVVVEGRVVTGNPERPAAGVGVGMYGPARPKPATRDLVSND